MHGPSSHIPRVTYGVWMALATIGALGCAAGAGAYFGGGRAEIAAAVTAVAIGSVLTLAPAVMRIGVEHWGVAVLLCGMARGLVALGAAYLMTQNDPGLAARPVFLGAGAGVLLLLAIESAAAVAILSRLERRRVALKHGSSTGAPPLTQA